MEKPQIFRSPTAVVVWVVWLLFAVGNWVDLAVQGRDHTSVVAAAVLLLATGAAYVTAQRPRIIVDEAGVTVRNPLRDHRIGWAGVAEVDLVDLLRVHCAWGPGGSGGEGSPPGSGGSRGVAPQEQQHHKVISAWAIHYSRRRQFAAEAKARRGARRSASAFPVGFGRVLRQRRAGQRSRLRVQHRGRSREDRQAAARARHGRPRRSRLGRQHRRDRRRPALRNRPRRGSRRSRANHRRRPRLRRRTRHGVPPPPWPLPAGPSPSPPPGAAVPSRPSSSPP